MDTLALQKYLDFSGSGIGVNDLLEFADPDDLQSLISDYSVDFGDEPAASLSMPKYGAISVGGSGSSINWTFVMLAGLAVAGGIAGAYFLMKAFGAVAAHPLTHAAVAKKLGLTAAATL